VLIRIGCQFDYTCEDETPSLWQVRPRHDARHRIVDETWAPPAPAHTYLDAYGNPCDRLTMPAGSAVLRYDAHVEVPPTPDEADPGIGGTLVEDLPDEAFVYLLASRFCWPDVLSERAWDLFGSTPPGWPRVQAVCDWVHGEVDYTIGSSTTTTTALDVWEQRRGVCRDFAHLGVTLCRALNIPARYVAGYLPDIGVEAPDLEMDFCSWFEAWLGGRWWTFDPRNNERRIGRVVVARGRDALDAAMVTTWERSDLQRMQVWADEVRDAR
jgi:transglutaminase-like putative cysteine protease